MGTGGERATLGAGVERVAVLVAGGHGQRTAPVALARAVLRDSTGRTLHPCLARPPYITQHNNTQKLPGASFHC